MKNTFSLLALLLAITIFSSCNNEEKKATEAKASDSTATGITLPAGFFLTVFSDSLGSARHIVFNNGDIFVKLGDLKKSRGILRLRDTNNDGVADDISGFGDYGGTGIVIKDGYMYASSDDDVYRYKMAADGSVDS